MMNFVKEFKVTEKVADYNKNGWCIVNTSNAKSIAAKMARKIGKNRAIVEREFASRMHSFESVLVASCTYDFYNPSNTVMYVYGIDICEDVRRIELKGDGSARVKFLSRGFVIQIYENGDVAREYRFHKLDERMPRLNKLIDSLFISGCIDKISKIYE